MHKKGILNTSFLCTSNAKNTAIQSTNDWPNGFMKDLLWKVSICPERKHQFCRDTSKEIVNYSCLLPSPKQCWTPLVATDHANMQNLNVTQIWRITLIKRPIKDHPGGECIPAPKNSEFLQSHKVHRSFMKRDREAEIAWPNKFKVQNKRSWATLSSQTATVTSILHANPRPKHVHTCKYLHHACHYKKNRARKSWPPFFFGPMTMQRM